jgi:hypothetical protein
MPSAVAQTLSTGLPVSSPTHVMLHEELEDHSTQRPPSSARTRPRSSLAPIRIGPPRQSHLQKPSMLPKPSMVADARAFLLQSKQHTYRPQQPICLSATNSPSHAEKSTPGGGELKVGGSESMSCREAVQTSQTSCDCTTASPSPCPTTSVSTAKSHSETASPQILKCPEAISEASEDNPEMDSQGDEVPKDMSQTLFMRLFRAYGGMDESEWPKPEASDKGAWSPDSEIAPSIVKAWHKSCKRTLSVTTDPQHRKLIQGWMMYHPPFALTKPLSDAAIFRGKLGALEQPHWEDPPEGSSVFKGPTPVFSIYVCPSTLPSYPLSRETYLKRGPGVRGSLRKGYQVSSFSFRVASEYEQLQQVSPARKIPRTTHKRANTSCTLAGKSRSQGSKLCSLCSASQTVIDSMCCKYVASAALSLSKGGLNLTDVSVTYFFVSLLGFGTCQ